MAYTAKQKNFRKRETKAEYAARKKAEKEAAYEMIDNCITEMMKDDESFISYLDFQSAMERYTAANTILIQAQCPQATQLKTKGVWKDLGIEVQVSEDEAIHILKPSDYIDKDGNPRVSYNVDYIYDISQTNVQPQPPQKPESNPKVLAMALMKSSNIKMVVADELPIPDSTAFYDHDTETLVVKKQSDSISLFKDISRELSLAEIAKGCDEYNREECLPSAVCSSYMLCQKYGIDNSNIDVESAKAQWQGKENKDVRTMLTMSNDALYSISKDIYVQMQRDKEKADKEPAR